MPSVVVHAWQSWRHDRGIFLLSVAALAVGMAATVAIYTVVNGVLLRPVGYADGERIGQLFGGTTGEPESRASLTVRDVLRYRDETQSFAGLGWFRPETYTLTSPGEPRHVQGAAVTPGLVATLGVAPTLGRWFTQAGEAVISQALWRSLGSDRSLVGRAIVLNGRTLTVTGVAPPRFRLPEIGVSGENVLNDVWVGLDERPATDDELDTGCFVYVRLRPRVSFAAAEADAQRVASNIARQDPGGHPAYTARLDSLRELIVRGIRPTVLALLGAAALLFLVTCANVAGLLLARAVARTRDTAVRVALGASRWHLALQFFLESLAVSLAGTAAGIVLSLVLVRIVVSIAADYIPRADEIALDGRVLVAALATTLVASALSSLAPLWQAGRTRANDVLDAGTRTTRGAASARLSHGLVVVEIALAFTLAAAGMLLAGNARAIARTWPGFDTRGLTTFELTLSDAVAGNQDRRVAAQQALVDAVAAIPGVQSAGFTNQTPLDGCCLSTALYPDGVAVDPARPQRLAILPVNPDYFQALGLTRLSGRLLTAGDDHAEMIPIVINQTAARYYWPGKDPVGATGHLGHPAGSSVTVVGVVGDIRNETLAKPTVAEVYLLARLTIVNPMHFLVRSRLALETLLPQLREAVHRVDPSLALYRAETMDEVKSGSLSLQRLASFMTGFFAIAALLMATLGIYGVLSYSVRLRTVEFGTRMALGAVSRDLVALVMRAGARMAAAGLALGTLGVLGVSWMLVRQLDLQYFTWWPYASSTATVLGVALVTAVAPAWRVSRFSPMMAIRDDPAAGVPGALSGLRAWRRRLPASLGRDDAPAVDLDPSMPAAFVDAARRAVNGTEALGLAVRALRDQLCSSSVYLIDTADGRDYRVIAAAAPDDTTPAIPWRGFLASRLRHHEAPLPLTAEDLEALLAWCRTHRPRYEDEVLALEALDIRLAIAIRGRDDVMAVLLFGPSLQPGPYPAAARQMVRQSAPQLALMLENTRLAGRMVEQAQLARDLALATAVQRRLLPEAPPASPSATMAGFTLAARNVAGDYYDFFRLDDHRIAVALADVSGKGIAAALIMSVVQASLRILTSDPGLPLADLAAAMNRFLYRATQSNSYATFFYARFDDRTRHLEYVNAGHNPPYVLRAADDSVESLPAGGTVIGLFPDTTCDAGATRLEPGDVLIVFTDGVTEALNTLGDEFGDDRLLTVLRDARHLDVTAIVRQLSTALAAWSEGAPQHDDITFVAFKANEP